MFGRSRRLLGILTASCAMIAAVAFAIPVSAQAALVNLGSCDSSTLSQPFTPWLDYNYYKLAPGADFEGSLSGWTLQGGASQGSGSESYGVTGSVGFSSLSVPAGATAISPMTCVNAAYPDFRMFTRTDTFGSSIAVAVLWNGVTIPVGMITPAGSWQLSLPMATLSAVTGALNGGTANIQIQLTGVSGNTQVDDVYVDPWGRCC